MTTFEFLFSLQKRTLLTEKLVQISLILSLFFSAAPKLLVDFSQQVHNARKNQIVSTLAGI